jgi:hypothetical protein
MLSQLLHHQTSPTIIIILAKVLNHIAYVPAETILGHTMRD